MPSHSFPERLGRAGFQRDHPNTHNYVFISNTFNLFGSFLQVQVKKIHFSANCYGSHAVAGQLRMFSPFVFNTGMKISAKQRDKKLHYFFKEGMHLMTVYPKIVIIISKRWSTLRKKRELGRIHGVDR